jgi:hypothetical protein
VSEKTPARIILVCGGSSTGKSAWVKQQVAKARRCVVWDITGEYIRAGFVPVFTAADLIGALSRREGRFAFVPRSVSLFDFFCRAAFAWGRCVVVVEELADVTSPGKAPPGWGSIIRRGRHRGLTVYGITQRPAESDKTIIGNCTLIHCCKLKRAPDRAYIAREMDVPQAKLDALKPLEWIEADDMGRVRRGKIRF